MIKRDPANKVGNFRLGQYKKQRRRICAAIKSEVNQFYSKTSLVKIKSKCYYIQKQVVSQDIYDTQREQLLEKLRISGATPSPKVDYNLTIKRKKPRPMGEGITRIIVDGITRNDVNIDSMSTLLLPLGTHEIYFKRAAVKSAVIKVTISASSQFTIEYNPGTFKIEARLL